MRLTLRGQGGVDGRPGNASRVLGRRQGRVPAAPSRRPSNAETTSGPEAETVSTMRKTQYAIHLLSQSGSIRTHSRLRERLFIFVVQTATPPTGHRALGRACIETVSPCYRGPGGRLEVANSSRVFLEAGGTHAGPDVERAVCSWGGV